MLTDGFVRVVCDKCTQSEEEIELNATARGYDDRGVDEDIQYRGWQLTKDGEHICPNCQGKGDK